MIRSLKTLGLALVAVLALSAVVASAASAAPKLTPVPEEYPVTLKGTQTATNEFELEGGRNTKCSTASFEGTATKEDSENSRLTVSPTFSNCKTKILGNEDLTTITMNGCDFLFTASATTTGTIAAEGWEVTGNLHVKCPEGKKIEIHVFATETKDLENKPLCTYTVEEQTPEGSLDYKLTEKDASGNGTSGDIKSTITGVTTTKSTGTETNCGLEMQTGSYRGEAKVEGFNAGGTMLRGKFED